MFLNLFKFTCLNCDQTHCNSWKSFLLFISSENENDAVINAENGCIMLLKSDQKMVKLSLVIKI